MSQRAIQVLEQVEAVAGYTTYIDLIRPLIQGKQIVSTAMKKEIDRVSAALDLALAGTPCAIVSSGDPGVYAMAGLVLEMCRERSIAIGNNASDTPTAFPSRSCPVFRPCVPGPPCWARP
jgi:precorrin-3B methylase